MTNEELFELVKSHFNELVKSHFNELVKSHFNIKKSTFDFTSNDINFIVVRPVPLEYIKFTCVLVDKEND
jgi:hypothetical protein